MKPSTSRQITASDLRFLPPRDPSGNKASFGKVLVIAGSWSICGAAILAGTAVLRSGAGMVKIYTETRNRTPLATALPEALLVLYEEDHWTPDVLQEAFAWSDLILMGPGLGTGAVAAAICQEVWRQSKQPLVLDADALHILADDPQQFAAKQRCCVLTPHVKELSDLTGEPIDIIKQNLLQVAQKAADQYGAIVVAKDAQTIIATPSGDSYLYTEGSSALSTAGSGDVLAGLTAGLLAQEPGILSENRAGFLSALAVWIHGAAGKKAAQQRSERSVLAGDLSAYFSDFL